MTRATLLVAVWASCAAIGAPAAAWGQAGAWDARLEETVRSAVAPTLEAAVRDSLPLAALRSKVLEGVAKGVPANRIATVVADFANELRDARALLRQDTPGRPLADGEIVAVAFAMRQGLPPEVIRTLWASRPDGGSLEIPVTVLGELVRRGVPASDASAVMAHVVRTSVPLHVAAQLPVKVDGALGAGVEPAAALSEAMRTLSIPEPAGRGPNE